MKKHPQHSPGLFEQAGTIPTVTAAASGRPNIDHAATPAGLARLQEYLWECTPAYARGIVRGEQCLQIGGGWPVLARMSGPEVIDQLTAIGC